MPPLDPLLPILGIAFLAGLVQGLSGFGSGLVAVPLLALLLPIETVVPLMTLLSTLISVQNLLHLRSSVRFDRVALLLAASSYIPNHQNVASSIGSTPIPA